MNQSASTAGAEWSVFPSGVGRFDFERRLLEFELDSNFPTMHRSLYDEGPILVSCPELPWGDAIRHLSHDAYRRFLSARTWMTGDALFAMERDMTLWLGSLMGAPDPVGVFASGGSESNLCAIATARAHARKPGSVVFPAYSHYSFTKACSLYGLTPIPVAPLDGAYAGVTPDQMERALRDDTIAIVATAGTFPYGTVDRIAEFGELAHSRGIYLHVDSCCGGFVLPFLERAAHRYQGDPWDFRVEGVSSISADLHKHGMAAPPASLLLFRDNELLEVARQALPPHGTLSGTRPGGPIAGAWATVTLLGTEGYRAVAAKSMQLRDQLIEGVSEIDGLEVYPGSEINLFTIYARTLDLYYVWLELRKRGWMLASREEPCPGALVVWVWPQNHGVIDQLLKDLQEAMEHAQPWTPGQVIDDGRVTGFDAYSGRVRA